MDKVSVIMSTYKTPHQNLRKSIDSILKQTYSNIEFIIVCDGDYAEYEYIHNNFNSPKIILLFNKTNMGLPYSLNLAIRVATGKYIARMDADDISCFDRIEKQLRYLKSNKLDLCGTAAKLFGENKGKKSISFYSVDEIKIQLLYRATLIHPSVLGKRELFTKNQYNEDYKRCQDFELWSRISNEYSIGFCPRIELLFRSHSTMMSFDSKELRDRLSKQIIERNANTLLPNDNALIECLWFLSGREKITKQNCMYFSKLVDHLIKKNQEFEWYNNKLFKKIIFNRFFELTLKNKAFIFDSSVMKKIFRISNFLSICKILSWKLL